MKVIAVVGPYHSPSMPKSQLKTQTKLMGIPNIQYPNAVAIEAIPYFPRPLMMPTPILCMQSKKTKMDNVNIVLDIRLFTDSSELKA